MKNAVCVCFEETDNKQQSEGKAGGLVAAPLDELTPENN